MSKLNFGFISETNKLDFKPIDELSSKDIGTYITTLDVDGVLINGHLKVVNDRFVELVDRVGDSRHLTGIDFFSYDTTGLEQLIHDLYGEL